ncbi:hypothetical protein MRB53_033334 [Persea americana]|uniref:Uncharacterized protein n=1 Tax=Persea americana TaxID=3435 RepID=A0ACC2KU89_PERAE|nr:hypothetical protein MRB53_033334 [Persea americana]
MQGKIGDGGDGDAGKYREMGSAFCVETVMETAMQGKIGDCDGFFYVLRGDGNAKKYREMGSAFYVSVTVMQGTIGDEEIFWDSN